MRTPTRERPALPEGPSRFRRWRRVAAWGAIAALCLVLAAGLYYRRQIVSMLTHRRGAPDRTFTLEPFATPPAVRIAAVGDVGEGEEEEWRTANAIDILAQEDRYDALLLLGDNVYPSGDPDRLDATVFEPFGMVLRDGTRLLAILGNHDVAGGHGLEQIRRLGMPGPWWTVAIGDVRIVGLDSNQPSNPDQLAFLERTLAEATEPWKLVAVHEPPYSAGYQGSNLEVRRAFVPLFRRYGVQLVLSGHEHDYQRSTPIDGVTYVVSGAGGRTRGAGEDAFTAASWSVLSFVDLNVFPDRLVLRAVTQDARGFDEVVIPAA
ncbi:MAG TPA: metallophosphoesterase [Actinomycetota bacterium]